MRICIPITNLSFHGNVVFDLAKELVKEGQEVTLVVPHAKGLKGEETVEGVNVKRFRYFWPSSLESLAYGSGIVKNIKKNPLKLFLLPFFFASFKWKVFWEARNCDVLHANWLPSALVSLPAKVVWRKPLVLTIHGTDVRGIPRPLVWMAIKSSNAITTSHEALVETVEMAGGKAEIVRNMIDYALFESPTGIAKLRKEFSFWNKPVVLYVGRLIDLRDPLTFIKAAELLPEANFVMVGHGRMLEASKKFVKERGIGNVFFTGRRADVENFFGLGKVFVSTATFDNAFSSVVVESAYSGTPMVLTNVGKTGRFFNSSNSILIEVGKPKQVAAAVKKLLNDKALAQKIALNAKQLLKGLGFERETILKKNLAIYKRLVR